MKYFVCSDIHGSFSAARRLVDYCTALACNKIILLGDILYHGPRNPLPEGYNPKETASLLNTCKKDIIACRGNCDSEVDQMMLEFPIMCDTAFICDNGVRILCSHGHVFSPEKLPPMGSGDVFFSGHTHIQQLARTPDGITLCNPGSPVLPKGKSAAGFAVYESGRICLYNMDGIQLEEIRIQTV